MISLLQAYRGIAAFLVVLFHAKMTVEEYFSGHDLLYIFNVGEAGVQFFFVLSGFIIFYIHKKDLGITANVYCYLSKRILRIYPVYIIITLIFTPFWLFMPDFGDAYHKEMLPLIKSLLLIPQNHNPHLGVAWTLTHEVLFYLLFATAIISKNLGKLVLTSWFCLVLALNFSDITLVFPFNFLFSINNLLFGMGIVTAMLLIRYKQIPSNRAIFIFSNIIFFIAALGAATFQEQGARITDVFFIILIGIASAMIILQAKDVYLETFFRHRTGLLLLGEASYSIYLIHFPVLSAVSKLLQSMTDSALHSLIIFIVMVIVATASGVLFHLLIEKPIIRLLSQYVKKRSC
jgi:peptidoglycan/LPS O-acetylase OafA/YrhL